MPDISVHDSKEEGEGDNGVEGRVAFLVSGNRILSDNFLEGSSELIQLEIGWWLQLVYGDLF